MASSRINLKNPVLAGVLAFLVPGLGHVYQGRTFKGLLYSVCILGTFFFGMRLGDSKVVYFDWEPEKRTWAYLCQFWTGLPALPALVQARFRPLDAFRPNSLSRPMTTRFDGTLEMSDGERGTLAGTVELSARGLGGDARRGEIKDAVLRLKGGEFKVRGTLNDFWIDPQVAPDAQRGLSGPFAGKAEGHNPPDVTARFEGSVARGFWDRYEAPLLDREFIRGGQTDLDLAHLQLGTRFELGVVYTMIAGLLNILAIYDALEGPAYDDDEPKEPTPDSGGPPPPEPEKNA